MTTITRPILRYHGGKFNLANWIINHFPPHRIYGEWYGGAGSVLLQKPRCYAEIYNDLDGEIVNVFRVFRDPMQGRELQKMLQLTPYAREEFKHAYSESDNPVERARRTIIRSFMGFGGDATLGKCSGFRSNTERRGTIPAHDWARYGDVCHMFIERLSGVVIESRPAVELMTKHDSTQTLHYIDPPYVHATRNTQHHYRYEMIDDDHRELAATLHLLKGMVVLSGYPSELYNQLYHDWQRIDRNALADGARKRIECLWLNPAAQRQQTMRLEL